MLNVYKDMVKRERERERKREKEREGGGRQGDMHQFHIWPQGSQGDMHQFHIWPQGYQIIFMLKSTEREISSANRFVDK